MNLYLIGFRCSGKSTIARLLADRLGLAAVDTDSRIVERCGCSIADWVNVHGWEAFRRLEAEALQEIIGLKTHQVVATGGGIVLYEGNIEAMKRSGFVVWLRIRPETAASRMKADPNSPGLRPGLTGKDPIAEIHHLLQERTPLYEAASDRVIDCDEMPPETIALTILHWIQEIRLWPEILLAPSSGSPLGENPTDLPSAS
uniref:Shikimate kinase n=1 Tax=Desulfatirhabdium butyrativorans TaxID=340467 RepID=A0A7C4RTW9_9BACT